MNEAKKILTAGQLRTQLEGVADELEVIVRIQKDDGTTILGDVIDAEVDAGCTDTDVLLIDATNDEPECSESSEPPTSTSTPTPPETRTLDRVTTALIQNLLRYFDYAHLPERLHTVVRPFALLAHEVAARGSRDTFQMTSCLRKLLEAKDCAVRAAL